MSKKSDVLATVGFFIVGLSAWMHGLPRAGWVDASAGPGMGWLPIALILLVLAVLAFVSDQVLDSVIFFGFAGLVWSHTADHAMAPASAMGWNLIVWALFFLAVWWSALKAGGTRMLFLLALWLTLLAAALASWSGAHVLGTINGYLDLIAGLLALAVSIGTATSGAAATS